MELSTMCSHLWEIYNPQINIIVKSFRKRTAHVTAMTEDDLWQEAYFALHKAVMHYQVSRPFMPWLATVIRNHLRDILRHEQRLANARVDISGAQEIFSDKSDRINLEKGETTFIKNFRDSLTNFQQEIFDLLYDPPTGLIWTGILNRKSGIVKKFHQKDIADFLGVPTSSVTEELKNMTQSWKLFSRGEK